MPGFFKTMWQGMFWAPQKSNGQSQSNGKSHHNKRCIYCGAMIMEEVTYNGNGVSYRRRLHDHRPGCHRLKYY